MTNKEAIKYLIVPTATSTKPSVEYLKQKEAYDLAVKALQNERPKGEWKETGYETGALGITYRQTQCSNCGAEMRKGGTK